MDAKKYKVSNNDFVSGIHVTREKKNLVYYSHGFLLLAITIDENFIISPII